MCVYCSHALHEKILDLDIIIIANIACFAAAWDHWYTSTLTIYVHGVGPGTRSHYRSAQ